MMGHSRRPSLPASNRGSKYGAAAGMGYSTSSRERGRWWYTLAIGYFAAPRVSYLCVRHTYSRRPMSQPETQTPEAPTKSTSGAVFICGPSKDYVAGDPPPSQEAGYMEFMAWQEAQLSKRRRSRGRR